MRIILYTAYTHTLRYTDLFHKIPKDSETLIWTKGGKTTLFTWIRRVRVCVCTRGSVCVKREAYCSVICSLDPWGRGIATPDYLRARASTRKVILQRQIENSFSRSLFPSISPSPPLFSLSPFSIALAPTHTHTHTFSLPSTHTRFHSCLYRVLTSSSCILVCLYWFIHLMHPPCFPSFPPLLFHHSL